MITAHDLMDAAEVAEAFGVTQSSLRVAMTSSAYPSLSAKLPAPLRQIGGKWCWVRADVEGALVATSDPCDPHGIPRPVSS